MKNAILIAALLVSTAAWPQAPKDIPLITDGSVTVTAEDFEAFLLRVPENHRPEIRASYERIGKAVDLLYTNRILAEEARRQGLDKDPLVQLRMKQIVEAYLAQRYVEDYRAKAPVPDLEIRAQEIYKLNKDRFTTPERISGTHLLITLRGRTREMALALAKEIRAKVVSGANFEELVLANTEDERARRTRGKLRSVAAKDLETPIAEAAFALKSPGDVTQPVETRDGFHIFQLESRTPAKVRPFEEVKQAIIADEQVTLKGLETDKKIGALKNNAATKVYEKNINALKVDMTPAQLERAQMESLTNNPPR